MVCHSCGQEFAEDASCCPYCGTSCGTDSYSNSAEKEKPDSPFSDSSRIQVKHRRIPPKQTETIELDSKGNSDEFGEAQVSADTDASLSSIDKPIAESFTTQYGVYEAVDQAGNAEQRFKLRKESSLAKQLRLAWKNLPRRMKLCFSAPQDLQKELEISKDFGTALLIGIPLLLLTFLCSAFSMRTVLYQLLAFLQKRSVNGLFQLYGNVVSQYTFRFGGVTVVTQLIAMLIGSGIPLLYIAVFHRQHFNPNMIISFLAVLSMPTLLVSAVGIIFSFFAPLITLLLVFLGSLYNSIQQHCLIRQNIRNQSNADFAKATVTCLVSSLLVIVINGWILLNTFFIILK